jgi:hypothetical protein
MQKWCLPFLMPLQPVNWINLKGKVTWKSVRVNCVFMKTVVPDLSLNEDDLFHEFSCVQKYCESKLKCGMKKITKILLKSVVKCWPIFTKENINAVNIKCLISFCLEGRGFNSR